MTDKIYIFGELNNTQMKTIDIRPVSELDELGASGAYVRVPQNGRGYTCHLKNGQSLTFAMRIRPAFRVYGTFREDDYEVPEFGLRIDKMLRQEKDISVSGIGDCLVYRRHLESVPKGSALPEAVRAFVSDVLSVSPHVADMVERDNKKLMERVADICRKYKDN
ncbi:MAG: hypothetical protein NTW67_01775 [Candidatus Woesearchaeota archaeon]|nr:hypothetical protein [Candidatus Woesearchaeota archaeon]